MNLQTMLTPEQCRAFDQYLIHEQNVPGTILMENAGRGCAELILKLHKDATHEEPLRVSVLCGSGNNGGDGFVIARHLLNAGAEVSIVLFANPQRYAGDAKIMLDCLELLGIKLILWDQNQTDDHAEAIIGAIDGQRCHWCVDALLGTGARGPLRPALAQAVAVANRLRLKRFAVDIPTGLDPTSGQAQNPTFLADHCATFVDLKASFKNPQATGCLGEIAVIDIGFTPKSCGWQAPPA